MTRAVLQDWWFLSIKVYFLKRVLVAIRTSGPLQLYPLGAGASDQGGGWGLGSDQGGVLGPAPPLGLVQV